MDKSGEKLLNSLHRVFNNYSDLDTTLDSLVKKLVSDIYPADAGIIYLYNADNKELVSHVSYGYPTRTEKQAIDAGHAIAWKCFNAQKPLLLNSKNHASKSAGQLKAEKPDDYAGIRIKTTEPVSQLAVPLVLKQQGYGVILLEQLNPKRRKFNDKDTAQLEIIANWASLVIAYYRSDLELKESKRSYRELLGKFLASTEDERKKIAREIHDEINHILLSVKLNLEDVEVNLPPEMESAREKLKVLRTHISKAFDDLHRLSLDLRPPGLDELGLPQALEWYVQTLSKEANLPIEVEVSGLSNRRPAPIVESELLRIAQGALSNVLKHAKAKSAGVKLDYGRSQLTLEITDDGIGFDVGAVLNNSGAAKKLGLIGMIERAEICGGELKIYSSPGMGTRLVVVVPVQTYDWGVY